MLSTRNVQSLPLNLILDYDEEEMSSENVMKVNEDKKDWKRARRNHLKHRVERDIHSGHSFAA